MSKEEFDQLSRALDGADPIRQFQECCKVTATDAYIVSECMQKNEPVGLHFMVGYGEKDLVTRMRRDHVFVAKREIAIVLLNKWNELAEELEMFQYLLESIARENPVELAMTTDFLSRLKKAKTAAALRKLAEEK